MEKIREAIQLLMRSAIDNEAPTGAENLAAEATFEFSNVLAEMTKATKIMCDYKNMERILKVRTEALVEIKNLRASYINGQTYKGSMHKKMKEIAKKALGKETP